MFSSTLAAPPRPSFSASSSPKVSEGFSSCLIALEVEATLAPKTEFVQNSFAPPSFVSSLFESFAFFDVIAEDPPEVFSKILVAPPRATFSAISSPRVFKGFSPCLNALEVETTLTPRVFFSQNSSILPAFESSEFASFAFFDVIIEDSTSSEISVTIPLANLEPNSTGNVWRSSSPLYILEDELNEASNALLAATCPALLEALVKYGREAANRSLFCE